MIRLIDELTDLERLSLIEISASRLSSFERCPAAYFYDYILFEPRGHNKYSLLGNVVHSVLEHIDFNQPLNYFEMANLFEDYVAHHDKEGEITSDLLDIGRQILAEYCQTHVNDEWHVEAKEKAFAIVIGPALVVGYIDRVDILGNTCTYTDYKTGRKEVPYKDVPNDFQLGIYALAMKKYYPNYRIIGQLEYLRSGRIKSHEFTITDLETMESRLIATINKIIETNTFHPTPNKSFCFWCSHAETKICAIGAKRLEK
jgi:RecB family exonuclease